MSKFMRAVPSPRWAHLDVARSLTRPFAPGSALLLLAADLLAGLRLRRCRGGRRGLELLDQLPHLSRRRRARVQLEVRLVRGDGRSRVPRVLGRLCQLELRV